MTTGRIRRPRRCACGSTPWRRGLDVVFGHYEVKQHSAWRNLGSRLTNKMTDWALDKPSGLLPFELPLRERVCRAAGRDATPDPYPYLDGLLLQVTQRIGSLTVRHDARTAGASGYTLRRLIRLWLSAWLNFSILPLRVATLVGLLTAFGGLLALPASSSCCGSSSAVPAYGWGWVMASVLIFSGTQLVMLGLIGEYLGRMFLTVNQRPQAVVREVTDVEASGRPAT